MSATRKFELIASDKVPGGALIWNGWKQRKEALSAWRKAVFYIFGARGSVMRVAWVLSDLFAKHGYAYASDGYLSKETFLSRRHVQEAIAALANGGAICRAHVPGKKTERRIFPSSKILAEVPPKFGTQKYIRRRSTRGSLRSGSLGTSSKPPCGTPRRGTVITPSHPILMRAAPEGRAATSRSKRRYPTHD